MRLKTAAFTADNIKYIAILTMTLNHIGLFCLGDTLLARGFILIGYFTAPVMLYFLTEGYMYTSSRARYALRLGAGALVSQIPFAVLVDPFYLNMMFTLLLSFLLLCVAESGKIPRPLKLLLAAVFILLALISDWGPLAPIFTYVFYRHRGDKGRLKNDYILFAILFAVVNFFNLTVISLAGAVFSLLSAFPVLLAGRTVLFAYNGKRERKHRTFHKWFFYTYYPLHLGLIALLR